MRATALGSFPLPRCWPLADCCLSPFRNNQVCIRAGRRQCLDLGHRQCVLPTTDSGRRPSIGGQNTDMVPAMGVSESPLATMKESPILVGECPTCWQAGELGPNASLQLRPQLITISIVSISGSIPSMCNCTPCPRMEV